MIYSDLEAWKASMELAQKIYEATRSFPREEIYGMTSQMRRAAVSIPSNIAEGSARQSDKDALRFIRIAQGSFAELETQIILAQRIGFFVPDDEFLALLKKSGRLLTGLAQHAERRCASSR